MNKNALFLGFFCWLVGAVLGLYLCRELRGDVPVKVVKGRAEIAELREGVEYYIDRKYKITDLPDDLRGFLIRTMNAHKGNVTTELKLRLNVGGNLYLLYDRRATALPRWMESWEKRPMRVGVSDNAMGHFDVYLRPVTAGEFELGGNFAEPAAGIGAMYCVVFTPGNWQRAQFDWRKEVAYWELKFVRVTNPRRDAVAVKAGQDIVVRWEPPSDRLAPGELQEDPPLPEDATQDVKIVSVSPSEVTGEASATVRVALKEGTWGLTLACVDTLSLRSAGSEWVFLSVGRATGRPAASVRVKIIVE